MGFSSWLLARDHLGTDISITYKGSDKFNTYVGSIVSLCIYGLVLVQLVEKLIGLFGMTDPSITILSRPIYEAENEEFGVVNLNDYRFNFGVYFKTRNADVEGAALQIPSSIGRVVLTFKNTSPEGSEEDDVYYDAVPCNDIFTYVNIAINELA